MATLSATARSCHQYLTLKDGEIAITNDPQAGGTRLSDLTLVMGVGLVGGTLMLLSCRIGGTPHLTNAKKIEDEGIRIPPMPLGNSQQINRELLGSICAHPLAPAKESEILNTIAMMGRVRKNTVRALNSVKDRLDIKNYFEQSKSLFKAKLNLLPLGAQTMTETMPDGTQLKLKIEIKEDRAVFDFTGCDFSAEYGITDLSTLGACFALISAATQNYIAPNAGSFQLLEVISPTQTIVNSKGHPTEKGMRTTVSLMCQMGMKAFGQLHKSKRMADSDFGLNRYELRFANGLVFSDLVFGGCGAQPHRGGKSYYHPWTPFESRLRSIEDVEKIFPIDFISMHVRSNSAGQGRKNGGDGTIKNFRLRENATIKFEWLSNRTTPQSQYGATREIKLLKEDELVDSLNFPGEHQLEKSFQVRLMSGGGDGLAE